MEGLEEVACCATATHSSRTGSTRRASGAYAGCSALSRVRPGNLFAKASLIEVDDGRAHNERHFPRKQQRSGSGSGAVKTNFRAS
jgi:hypothetical protein